MYEAFRNRRGQIRKPTGRLSKKMDKGKSGGGTERKKSGGYRNGE